VSVTVRVVVVRLTLHGKQTSAASILGFDWRRSTGLSKINRTIQPFNRVYEKRH